MVFAVFLVPLVSGLAAFCLRPDRTRRALLVGTALVHAALTASAWAGLAAPAWGGWLALDQIGLVFLSIVSTLFLATAVDSVGYLDHATRVKRHLDSEERRFFSNEPEAIFTGCLLLFLASMTLVTVSQHFGLLWVGIEATTLASAPLIYFHRHHRSLEATWKYLLICSVGIALALLGNFLLAVAASVAARRCPDRIDSWPTSRDHRAAFMPPGSRWRSCSSWSDTVPRWGSLRCTRGCPIAHSQRRRRQRSSRHSCPGAAADTARSWEFCGLIRSASPPVLAPFSQGLLQTFGLLSMALAAVFILGQSDFQANARLLKHRAHGNSGARRWARRRGGLWHRTPRRQPLANKSLALPGRWQHPGRLRDQVRRKGSGAEPQAPILGAYFGSRASWRLAGRPPSARSSASSRSSRRRSTRAVASWPLATWCCSL